MYDADKVRERAVRPPVLLQCQPVFGDEMRKARAVPPGVHHAHHAGIARILLFTALPKASQAFLASHLHHQAIFEPEGYR